MSAIHDWINKQTGNEESGFKDVGAAIEKNREGFNAPITPTEMPRLRQKPSRRRSTTRQRARGGRSSTLLTERDTLG